jgi:translation initiation factor IF-3
LRINHQIRAKQVRLIGPDGNQVGIVSIQEAMRTAVEASLDLVEVVPESRPPVCKVIDYGKYRYDQTKKEKESKKSQHQIKVKEIKVKPNIDIHDFQTKLKRARQFLEKGNKVKVSCMFRGREMMHTKVGERVVREMCEELADLGSPESSLKLLGRTLVVVLSPTNKGSKKVNKSKVS